MIDTPQIVQTGPDRTAIIGLTCPRREIRQVMGPAISELVQTVVAQGVGPIGTWHSHHHRMTPPRLLAEWMSRWEDVVDFEVHPVLASPDAAARVASMSLPRTPEGA